ncbi:thioredoxin domain-containing protein [Allopontixanthobacter sediminis]|uniref:Thioredoxin domain-containing protein n=1 Tax=Allopontixanthobacter sediminis TaxID=1689985 RepID=A0A845AZA3_9SPHN|nr:thioredoxin domain-containing protein [Allopontixanthobacter sediminis]MXP43204.1 thioredoxin domain-containing protein [Allopontixanthobacter sediminis]
MTTLRRSALLTFAAPLALGLAACGDSATTEGEVAEGEPIADIAAPAGQSWADTATVSEYDGYVMGNPDAPVKLVEYASLTCGACAAFSTDAAEPLREEYINSGVVSYEIRNQVHNPIDLVLARLVRCGQPESFHPLAEQVWSNLSQVMQQAQANGPALEAAMSLPEDQRFAAIGEASGLFDFFAARGISRDQARTCLADNASVMAIAQRSEDQSTEFNVTGTPTFFLNGSRVDGTSWTVVEPLLQRAGAR